MRIATLLHDRGLKLTPQRRAVLDVIKSSSGHLTPAEIYERVHKRYPSIGLVTIYRTLEVLTSLDLICRVHGEQGCHSYLLRRRSGHHHHMVCSSCGRVADFTRCDIEELERRVARQTGFKVQGHILELYGTCGTCQKATRVYEES